MQIANTEGVNAGRLVTGHNDNPIENQQVDPYVCVGEICLPLSVLHSRYIRKEFQIHWLKNRIKIGQDTAVGRGQSVTPLFLRGGP